MECEREVTEEKGATAETVTAVPVKVSNKPG